MGDRDPLVRSPSFRFAFQYCGSDFLASEELILVMAHKSRHLASSVFALAAIG